MNANCSICSDLFDGTNPISAAPCGHVYHTRCLKVWVRRAKTCPQCRSCTKIRDIQELYLNFSPESGVNSSHSENDIAHLTTMLSKKEVELESSKKEKQKAFERACAMEKRLSDTTMIRENKTLVHETLELRLKTNCISELEAEVINLQQVNTTLVDDLKSLNDVRTVVSGAMKDAEDILKVYNDHSKAARELSIYCACLKRELHKTFEHKDKFKDLNSKLKCENKVYAREIKFYEDALQIRNS